MDDDLYPNDGSYFLPREPKEQKIARRKEQAQTLESISVLEDLVKSLDAKIDFYENITSIPDEVRLNPSEFLIMHNTHTLMAKNLRAEKENIEELISIHKR